MGRGNSSPATRGYFGIGVYRSKTEANIGTLWRSAYQLDAAFIFTVGHRYREQASDTLKTWRHIPLHQYATLAAFQSARPHDCPLVGIEFCDRSVEIGRYKHPHRAIYILGAEDGGLPNKVVDICQDVIELPAVRTPSFNVAVAGSIVMFDRTQKQEVTL